MLRRVSSLIILSIFLFSAARNCGAKALPCAPEPQELPSAPSVKVTEQQQQDEAKRRAEQKSAEDAAKVQRQKDAAELAAAEKVQAERRTVELAKSAETERQRKALEAQGNDDFTITTNIAEVPVVFTVTDRHGRYIKGLKESDFNVLEDKSPVAKLSSFHSESDLPLRVGLLIDASASIRERFKFEQEAAIEFLISIIRPSSDRAFVMQFDDVPLVNTPFTNNQENLAAGVRVIRPGGGTALYDAIYSAGRDVLMKQREATSVRKAIILLTDGDDVVSHVTREEAIEMAQRAEVIVYCISTENSPEKSRGGKTLDRIAEATGGRAFYPFLAQDVANAFQDIQEELRSQYSLFFPPRSKAADGVFHSLEVVPVNKRYHVRSRKGYFAPGKSRSAATKSGK